MPTTFVSHRSIRRLLVGGLLALAASHAAWAQQAAPWRAAWQAPQSDAFLSVSVRQATMREIITTHAGGSQLRLRVSNLQGKVAVRLGAVSIGVSAGGAQIAAGGPVAVRFGGQPGLTLAPGESRYSDPIALTVQAMQRLSVSFHLPDSTLSMSRHFTGNELVWTGPGNLTGQASGQGFTQNGNLLQASTVLVDRLEVEAPAGAPQRVVAMFGDSITDGFMGSASGIPLLPGAEPIGKDVRFPDFLQRRALAEGVDAVFVNAAISGNRLLSGPFLPMFGPSGLSRLDSDVRSLAGVTDAVVLIGINDLGLALVPSLTGPRVVAGLGEVVRQLRQQGIRVTLGTLLPSRGASFGLAHGGAAVDAARKVINAWVKSSGVADAVIDFDACMQEPGDLSRLAHAYDSGDGLHPNTLGYQAMAACVDLDAFR